MNRIWLIIAGVIVLVAAAIWFGQSVTGINISSKPPVNTVIDSYFVNVKTHDFDREGKLSAGLQATRAQRFLGSDVIQLELPRLVYYKQDPNWRGYAKAGQYDTDKEIFTLQNDVLLERADDSAQLTTELLIYKKQQNLIESPEKVTITAPEGTTTGRGMTLNLQTETLDLHHDVESIYEPAKASKKP